YVLVAYGLSARIAHRAVEIARDNGVRAGLLRPKTLWPFPSEKLRELAMRTVGMLVVEMNAGQMVEDVRLAVEGRVPVQFYGRMGGIIPSPDEVVKALETMIHEPVEENVEEH
ncbi:MAG: transketolase C-terminal domain-containing protein, partial [Bacteroidota bacterium]